VESCLINFNFHIVGLILGAIIKYAYKSSEIDFMDVVPDNRSELANVSSPPDAVWLHLVGPKNETIIGPAKTYAYTFKGEVFTVQSKEIENKVKHGHVKSGTIRETFKIFKRFSFICRLHLILKYFLIFCSHLLFSMPATV